MIFVLSKVLWLVAAPGNLLLLVLSFGVCRLALSRLRRGYAAVYQDCRGRYGSEGEDHVYGDDALDGVRRGYVADPFGNRIELIEEPTSD